MTKPFLLLLVAVVAGAASTASRINTSMATVLPSTALLISHFYTANIFYCLYTYVFRNLKCALPRYLYLPVASFLIKLRLSAILMNFVDGYLL